MFIRVAFSLIKKQVKWRQVICMPNQCSKSGILLKRFLWQLSPFSLQRGSTWRKTGHPKYSSGMMNFPTYLKSITTNQPLNRWLRSKHYSGKQKNRRDKVTKKASIIRSYPKMTYWFPYIKSWDFSSSGGEGRSLKLKGYFHWT